MRGSVACRLASASSMKMILPTAASAGGILVIVRMLGANAYLIASVLPFLALGVTVIMGAYFKSALLSDSTIGRLARSGNVLLRFNESQLLGLVRPDVSVFDSSGRLTVAPAPHICE